MLLENFSRHAVERAAQRNIDRANIDFICQFGQKIHNGGALFIFLGKHDIPDNYRRDDRFAKLEGTVIMLSRDGQSVITVYKNRNGLKTIRKKCKYFKRHNMAA